MDFYIEGHFTVIGMDLEDQQLLVDRPPELDALRFWYVYQRILASLLRNVASKSVFYFLNSHTESYRAESLEARCRHIMTGRTDNQH